MAKLKRRDDLGAPPSARSGSSIVRIDGSAEARGIQDLGKGLAKLGTGLEVASEQVDPAERFETERRFQEFKWGEKLALDDTMRNVEPGKVDNFANGWADGYKEKAKAFLDTVPKPLQTQYDSKLFGVEREYYGSAATFARNEQKRYSLNQIEDARNTYGSRASAGEPLDRIRSDYDSLLAANPFLTPIEKDEVLRKGYASLEEAHVLGRVERGENLSEILRDLNGGEVDSDKNPETRAKLSSAKALSRSTSRFDATVNQAISDAATKHGVDADLLATFAQIESSGRPGVRTGSYKGLFQLSNGEFKKHGGSGNIYDASANADAAAAKLKKESESFQNEYGRAPTALDLYLTHQQGEGGYANHMANPERPAWQNMLDTAEGRKKGEKWAKAAIWGNIPNDVKARFPGGVENVSSAEFMELWQEKIDRISGGLPAATTDSGSNVVKFGPYRHLSSERRNTLINKARIASRNIVLQDVRDGAEEIRRTGSSPLDADGESAIERAERVLTKNQLEKAKIEWQEAQLEYDAFNDLDTLTEEGLQERLIDIEPKAGEDLYEVKAKIFDKAMKRADDIRDQRDRDPAASVSELPIVQVAEQGVRENPEDPTFKQALIQARIDAQASVGIPEGLRSPVTKAEARVLLAPTKGLKDEALYKSLEDVQAKLEEEYGPYARSAATKIFEYDNRSRETAEELASVLDSAFKGQKPTAAAQRRLEVLNETDRATRAFEGDFVGDPFRQYQGRPEGVQPAPFQVNPMNMFRMRKPPQAAVDALRNNPALAEQFDEHYGTGSADRALAQ